MELYSATPSSEQDLDSLTGKYNGSYNLWTGKILHIATKSRSDLSYLAMRLAGYNNCPTSATYKALYQGMCYMYHPPRVPIMFPPVPIKSDVPLQSHFEKGDAVVTNSDYS